MTNSVLVKSSTPFTLALLTCAATLLGAQTAAASSQLPAGAEPDRVRDQITIPQNLAAPSADVSIPDIRIEGAPDGADKIVFQLNSLTLEGVQAYDETELAAIYQPYIGQQIPLTLLYEIASRITQKYRADGYIITQVVVPQQQIEGGHARLLVVEGALNGVSVEGEVTDRDRTLVAKRGDLLTQSTPLHADDLERYLLLINDIPGLSARSIIGPSNIPGKADIRIIVDRSPYNVLLSADNYGSKYLGPLQLTSAVQLNNPLGLNDRLLAQLVVAPQRDELYYSYLSYDVPVSAEGTTIRTDASYSDTAPGHDIRIFKPKGHSAVLGLTVSHPIIRTRSENLVGFARFDYQNSGTTNLLGVKTQDHIRSLRVGASYEKLSTALGTSLNTASVQVSKGLNIFNASRRDEPRLSRPDGDPQYTKIEAEFSRLQRIKSDLNAFVAVKGQKASDALLSAEEFGLGGMSSGYGRGYDPSEITGDHGFGAKAELQWNANANNTPLDSVQLYGFYDVGTVWDDDASSSKNRRMSIASTGFGARASIGGLNADATVAVPLTRRVSVENDKDPRFYLSLSGRF